jgi:hypothetical protein
MKSVLFWVVTPCSSEKLDISEENVTTNLRVEEYAKQETSRKQAVHMMHKKLEQI